MSKKKQLTQECSNGESMEEEEEADDTVNGFFTKMSQARKKDKRLKCKRCGKGGHEDTSCIEKKSLENVNCHICHLVGHHDSLECPLQDEFCNKCGFIGHKQKLCKLGT